MIDRIRWIGYGSFVIQGSPLIYINPWRVVLSAFLADVILVGHDHYEHFSQADIEKLRGPDTLILTNAKVADQIEGAQILQTWHSQTVDRARFTAVPAYSPEDPRHAADEGGLGFIISLDYYDIYYAGDTQIIPEMDRIHPDIAILPIDGNGTLTVDDAVSLVKQMRPRYVIPSNWGGVSGISATQQDVERFKDAISGRAELVLPKKSGDA